MVIEMNETQVRTLELVRRVVEGTEALEFRRCEDDEGRYAWIESVLGRFDYRQSPSEAARARGYPLRATHFVSFPAPGTGDQPQQRRKSKTSI